MHSKLTKYISIILAIVMIAALMPGYQPAARAEAEELAGRTLSVLGASISTYAGTSNGDAADTTNSTIRSNEKYYPNATVNDVALEDTWWMQAADDLGLRLLVNNSWSGSSLLHTRNGTVGAYVERCVQLHDDTGDNAGELPDIIAIQMGTNDFQYYKDTLGTADIDYAALIAANDDGTYTYAEPVTSLEAAAIVLHKIGVRYPDAEVYYLNISQRVDDTDELIRSFNAELKQVVEHFGAHIVDIYGSAITMADFDKYIGDGRVHPNKLGMDVYTEAFKEALLANTAYEAEYHKVSMNLTDVAADYGTDRLVPDGEAFEVKLSAAANDAIEVKVTMGGRDITADAYKSGTVTIGSVADDVLITAAGVHSLKSYRWEFDGGELACVSGENALTKNAGTTTDGVFSKTRYALKEAVVLNHDEAWAVEWKCEGTWQNSGSSSGARVFTTTDVNADYNARYIFKSNTNGLIAMGEKDSNGSHNYGIALGDHDIDWTALHTYRLENRIADDGSNMIYLSVDGEEIGAMTGYYIGTKSQNTDSDWLSGKDFVFPYMGTDTHGFTNCSIEYIAVCEGDTAHTYTPTVTLPTCTAQGYTTYTCTSCGDVYRTAWLDAAAYEGKTIACIGDSITCGVGVTKDETDYVYLLAEQLGMNYIRLGVSGTTLCTDGSRTCNISKLTEGNLNGADVVTIAMGINDFCAAAKGYYELGDINSTDSSTIYGAARMWCERIEELRKSDSLSDTRFYFVTPVIASWNSSVTSARNWDQSKVNVHGYTLRDLCNAIIEVAALYDVPVIDLNLTSGMYYVSATDNNTAAFGGDGVHPGPNGHAMMADALANALLQNDLRNDHTHTYGSWITTKYPGCANGEEKRVCSVCTAVERQSLAATGAHTYASAVTPPTCTQQGYTTYTCAGCGDSYVADYTEPRPLNILMIGNSFSWDAADFWYDMQESMTYDAMKNMLADSYDVHLAVMYKGSATLAYHATCAMNNTAAYTYTEIGPETNYKWTPASGNNATNSILERLEAREWDIIVVQSYQHEADGTEPRSTYTGGDSRFVEPEASTGYLLDYFAEHEPNAEIYYYMPWASTKFYGSDTEAGYRAIAEYSKNRVPEFKGTNSGKQLAGIIPVGTGIQNARTTYFDELRFSSGTGSTALLQDPQNGLQYDSQHLSFGLGRYIAGIVVAETLIPQAMRVTSYTLPAVKDSPSVGALPQEYSAIAQLAAENAVSHPYQITALNGYETDLADRICEAIEAGNYASEEIEDEAALAEYLQSVVDAYLENAGAAESEITIHSFVLENGRIKELDAGIALRVGYTKRTARINVVDGQSHRFGDWIHVTAPTANEVGIDSRTCAACGFTQIVEVEGSWQKYNLAEHLQELPEKFCHKTNLWAELEPESLMVDHLGKWVSAGATVYSVTIPIAPGDKIYANSFDVTGTKKGIQVSFIGNYGIVKTTFSSGTHEEFCENGGYLIAPEGAIAVNIPVWNVNADDNVINILNAEHIYDVNVTPPTCTQQGYTTYTCACGDSYVADYVDELGHTPGEAVKENETAGGAHDSVVYCTECGNELSREHVEGKTHTPGDINGDGSVNNKDFTRLFQYLADWDVEVVEAALDVNGDGTVNNKDLTRLFQYLSDWDVAIH